MIDLKLLRNSAKGLSVLYVDESEKSRVTISDFLSKIFQNVFVAKDGLEALEKFKANQPAIVLSELKIPKLDGFKLAKQIRAISKQSKFIILSAYDEKKYLHAAISLGVFEYLSKPIDMNLLTRAIALAIRETRNEEESTLLNQNIWNIFNYQNSMIVMMDDEKPIIANHAFLDFFGFNSIDDFHKNITNLGKKFLKHDGFLYDSKDVTWLDKILYDDKNSYNVLIKNVNNEKRHLIVHYQDIPQKNAYYILSFEDVTSLNISRDSSEEADEEQEKESVLPLLDLIMKKHISVDIHNYYKGLSITNRGFIRKVDKDTIVLETQYDQQKAIKHEETTILTCEMLPKALRCKTLVSISFKNKFVALQDFSFMDTSPIARKTARVIPQEGHIAKLLLNSGEIIGNITVADISIYALKIVMTSYPVGLKEGDECSIELELEELQFESKVTMYRRYEGDKTIDVVFMFEFEAGQKSALAKYVTKRQMATIREFKGLRYE